MVSGGNAWIYDIRIPYTSGGFWRTRILCVSSFCTTNENLVSFILRGRSNRGSTVHISLLPFRTLSKCLWVFTRGQYWKRYIWPVYHKKCSTQKFKGHLTSTKRLERYKDYWIKNMKAKIWLTHVSIRNLSYCINKMTWFGFLVDVL